MLVIDVGVGSEKHRESSQASSNISTSLPLVKKKGLCCIVVEYYRTDSAHRNYLKYLRVTQLVHIVLHLECK